MTRGIVIYGVNNATVDYVQLAVMNAAFIRRNMPGVDVCLITDEASRWAHAGKNRWPLSDYFSHVKTIPSSFKEQFENNRSFRDTSYHIVADRFRNESRSLVYSLSPFDETLLVDADYLICSDTLSAVWGSREDVMINNKATSLLHSPLQNEEFRLNPFGIRMYWATVIYFRKSERTNVLFQLVEHIRDNWEFYKLTYDFPSALFRNDYAFSIAIHILNGRTESDDYVGPLPYDTLLTSVDRDQFWKINGVDDLSLFANIPDRNWLFNVTRIQGIDVHVMNKLSLLNNMESIMEVVA